MIHCACPRKEEDYYQPRNYKNLIYFFSDADWINKIGRPQEGSMFKNAIGYAAVGAVAAVAVVAGIGYAIYKINKDEDDDIVSYSDKKSSKEEKKEPALSTTDATIRQKVDAACKVVGPTLEAVAITGGVLGGAASFLSDISGTNEFKKQPDNRTKYTPRTLGFRTQIDGSDPGHSDVINVVSHLISIWKNKNSNHKDEVNTLFNLNIDTKKKDTVVIVFKERNILKLFNDIKEDEEGKIQPS